MTKNKQKTALAYSAFLLAVFAITTIAGCSKKTIKKQEVELLRYPEDGNNNGSARP